MNEPDTIDTGVSARTPGFLVVGVGASAGGLESFEALLRNIPGASQLALVLVQHLAREHPSFLTQLLGARTALTVVEGREGDRLQPGQVYVIQPNTHISVVDGCLRVQPRPSGRTQDVPVDHLFGSMAEEYREKAVVVILSGNGSDGSYGVQQVNSAGGMTFAQTPEEARAPQMPSAAIATGSVSRVAPIAEIAGELVRLAEHPLYRRGAENERPPSAESDEDLQNILRALRKVTGVDFSHYKQPTIRRRIQRRMAVHHVQSLSSYLSLLTRNVEEANRLHDDLLIHVTSFFRDPESFEALKQEVLPQLMDANRGDGPIRVWVPGCSSGEEAYSLAMTLLQLLESRGEATPITVFGTDLSQRMIEYARAGVYSEAAIADVPPELLKRYFTKVDGAYRVTSELRERCVFARQDITRDPPFSKLDLVMCRNLLIYLSQHAQRKVTEIFHYALLPHGMLALGRSESIGALPELFSVVDSRRKIYRRKRNVLTHTPPAFGLDNPEPLIPGLKHVPRALLRERRERDFQADTNRLLLERYAPPLVVVDDAFRVVRTQGRVAPYLELPSGAVSLDVLRMLRPSLMSPVRSALQEARTSGDTARRDNVEVRSEDELRVVSVEVTRLGQPENFHYLVLFEEPKLDASPLPRKIASGASEQRAVEQLQLELSEVRAELESLIQELETANEELQSANEETLSSNEELQSTNEELDTAREELQATNEELGTVNQELQERNEELSRANSDLLNLLDSVDIPIVMVTSDTRIRRFTRAAERALNLIPADVGRPIGHIKPDIEFPDLEAELREAIAQKTMRDREVRDSRGRMYLATIRPNTHASEEVDGAMLALLDVPRSLNAARETSDLLLATTRDPVLLLDANLVVQRANEAFCNVFGLSAAHAENESIFELNGSRWDTPDLRSHLNDLLHHGSNFRDLVVEARGSSGDARKLLFDGTRVGSGHAGEVVLLLIIREEHDS